MNFCVLSETCLCADLASMVKITKWDTVTLEVAPKGIKQYMTVLDSENGEVLCTWVDQKIRQFYRFPERLLVKVEPTPSSFERHPEMKTTFYHC